MANNELSSVKKPSFSALKKLEHAELVKFKRKILKQVKLCNKEIMEHPDVSNILEHWMATVLEIALDKGKLLSGILLKMTYKGLIKQITLEDVERVNALGWIMEIIQTSRRIINQTETHRRESQGKFLVNDAFMLEMVALRMLHIYFEKQPYYNQLYDFIMQVISCLAMGQSLNLMTENSKNILDIYTLARYDTITQYKIAYLLYAPVALAFIMIGMGTDTKIMQRVEKLTLKLGHYLQVQNDYLSCFGDSSKTEKFAADIQSYKCTWLFVQAIHKANGMERSYLLENYGQKESECVENVKWLYKDLGLNEVFCKFEEKCLEEIRVLALDLEEATDTVGGTRIESAKFLQLLNTLYRPIDL